MNPIILDKFIEIRDNSLTAEQIRSLIRGKVHAIVLKNFYAREILTSISEKLRNYPGRGALQHAPEFERIGYAYSEISTAEQREQYHEVASKNFSIVQELFGPAPHPIDEFLLLLKKAWPHGADLLEINLQKCFVGICRFMNPHVDLNPHTDKLDRNLPTSFDEKIYIESQLSTNIYINMPEKGGEIEFWDIEPTEEQYINLMGNRHYGIDRNILPPPVNTYKPEQGDLLILNARRIHAVRPVYDKQRITISCFIGYRSNDLPLNYWS